MSDKQEIQQVIIKLSDGRTLRFTGKAEVYPDDKKIGIVDIKFSEPIELPDGYSWDIL
jgi:hypothetical protein